MKGESSREVQADTFGSWYKLPASSSFIVSKNSLDSPKYYANLSGIYYLKQIFGKEVILFPQHFPAYRVCYR